MTSHEEMLKQIRDRIGDEIYELNKDYLYYKNGSIYFIKSDFKYEVANCYNCHITSGIENILMKSNKEAI